MILNLNGSNLFEMWGEAPCLAGAGHCGLLGAIRIQLIMMIYVEGIMLEAGLLVRYDY